MENTMPNNMLPEEVIKESNAKFIEAFQSHVDIEMDFVDKILKENSNTPATVNISGILHDAISHFIKNTLREYDDAPIDLAALTLSFIKSIETLFYGGILSPLTGDDNEWVEVEKDIDRDVSINFRGQEISFKVTSVEQNARYPRIYRFNHDNRFAHNVSAVGFVDVNSDDDHPSAVRYTEESIRYIKFPYTLTSVEIESVFDDAEIVPMYLDDIKEMRDQIVFADCWHTQISQNSEQESIVVLSPVPYHLLPENVDIEDEIRKKDFWNNLQDDDDDIVPDTDANLTEDEVRNTDEYKLIKEMIIEHIATQPATIESIRQWLHAQQIYLNDESIEMVLQDIAGETSDTAPNE